MQRTQHFDPGVAPQWGGDAAFLADVLSGLSRPPGTRTLPSKYFYDARGSELFEAICEQPEYYPARTELALMERYAGEIAEALGPRCSLVELGSGSSRKTRALLDALEDPALYVPIDISRRHLEASVEALRGDYPTLPIMPVVADFTRPFPMPLASGESARTIIYVPGCTLWNLALDDARALLARLAALCGPDGGLVIGVDRVADEAALEAAYDDAAGVTAAFNKNLLVRLRDELGALVDVSAFTHRARYDAAHRRVEMQLVARREQRVRLAGRTFRFAAGEAITTEHSHKLSVAGFETLAASAGFEDVGGWTDDGRFSVRYARVV